MKLAGELCELWTQIGFYACFLEVALVWVAALRHAAGGDLVQISACSRAEIWENLQKLAVDVWLWPRVVQRIAIKIKELSRPL